VREKLKEHRLKKELTQMQIASLIGIKRSTYTNIELGYKNPSFNVATKIKKILDYQNDDIFLDVTCQKDTMKTSK